MPKVEWTEDAIEDLERLDKPIAKRLLKKISWFSQHFNNIIPEPLSAKLHDKHTANQKLVEQIN